MFDVIGEITEMKRGHMKQVALSDEPDDAHPSRSGMCYYQNKGDKSKAQRAKKKAQIKEQI